MSLNFEVRGIIGELAPLLSRRGHEKHSAYKSACPDSESIAQFGMQTQIQNANPNLDVHCALSVYLVSFTQVLGHTGSVQRTPRKPASLNLESNTLLNFYYYN